MGQASISCFNRVADILDKDHQKPKGKKEIIIELPRCVKRAWSPVETLRWEFLLLDEGFY